MGWDKRRNVRNKSNQCMVSISAEENKFFSGWVSKNNVGTKQPWFYCIRYGCEKGERRWYFAVSIWSREVSDGEGRTSGACSISVLWTALAEERVLTLSSVGGTQWGPGISNESRVHELPKDCGKPWSRTDLRPGRFWKHAQPWTKTSIETSGISKITNRSERRLYKYVS